MRALILLALWAFPAWAGTERLALVVGHNRGAPPHAPLRFAEADAEKVAAVLQELGGVKAEQLKLLKGADKAAVLDGFEWATRAVSRVHERKGEKAMLIVYFSSHSDEQTGLELGPEKLGWKELKGALAATGADVRLAVVDACASSGLLEAGGRAAPPFEIKLDDQLHVSGEALITSSASNEPSVEAGAFHGSVFTHHLLDGLRGAADASGDGRVTLEEAYRYAYDRTVEGESGQHPGYGLRLSGHGELSLTELSGAPRIVLPSGSDAVVVRDAAGERVVEARRPEGRELALPPGRYGVELSKDHKSFEAEVALAPKQKLTLDAMRLTERPKQLALVRLGGQGGFCAGRLGLEGKDARLFQLADALSQRLGKDCAGPKLDGVFSLAAGRFHFAGHLGALTVKAEGEADGLVDRVLEAAAAAAAGP